MKELEIIGWVGKDPEIRFSPQGVRFISFSVGCMNYDKNAETEWVEVSCSEKSHLFETISKNVKKGSKLLCRGKNRISAYVQRDTGKPIPVESMYLNKLIFLDNKENPLSTEAAPPVHSDNSAAFTPPPDAQGDIPF